MCVCCVCGLCVCGVCVIVCRQKDNIKVHSHSLPLVILQNGCVLVWEVDEEFLLKFLFVVVTADGG